MPWQASEAKSKTLKANTPAKKRQWAAVANSVLKRSENDGLAIREANGAVAKMASGGLASLNSIPYADKTFERSAPHVGFIHSLVPGRTDRLPMNVKANSFVVPADIVSTIGQGNSNAGASLLGQITKGPYGLSVPHGAGHANLPKPPKPANLARGGKADYVPVILAGGEFVIDPEDVEKIGGGDMKEGHRVLNDMVLKVRKHGAKKMLSLKPPKK